jgi:phenylacetic acid degradation operon negative regulatory protein
MPEPDPADPTPLLRRRSVGEPAARSLLLTVLGEYVLDLDEPVWTGALLRALAALGVGAPAARQAVTRSAAEGWLARDRVGRRARWLLTPATRDLLVRGRERIYGFQGITTGWDGRWLLVMVRVPEGRREDRHRVRTQLAWAGFGSLGQGTWITPHLEREREALAAIEGLGPVVQATSFVARHGGIGAEQELVASAWGRLDELERHYAAFCDQFGCLRPSLDAEQAFVAQTRLVHEWRKFPFLDPGLPERFLPAGWRGVEAAEVFRRRHAEWAAPATAWFRAVPDAR